VLDSFALLAYLQDEPGAQLVQDVLADESAIEESGVFRRRGSVYCELAERRQGTIVTGDPEFKQLAHLSIKWLPSPY
jgi:uncharacterized protein with PIN domain